MESCWEHTRDFRVRDMQTRACLHSVSQIPVQVTLIISVGHDGALVQSLAHLPITPFLPFRNEASDKFEQILEGQITSFLQIWNTSAAARSAQGFQAGPEQPWRASLPTGLSILGEHPPACSSVIEKGVGKTVTANLEVCRQHLKCPPTKPRKTSILSSVLSLSTNLSCPRAQLVPLCSLCAGPG